MTTNDALERALARAFRDLNDSLKLNLSEEDVGFYRRSLENFGLEPIILALNEAAETGSVGVRPTVLELERLIAGMTQCR